MTTPENHPDTGDITVSDLARELDATHYVVQTYAAKQGPDSVVYRSRGMFRGDNVLTGQAADGVRDAVRTDRAASVSQAVAQETDPGRRAARRMLAQDRAVNFGVTHGLQRGERPLLFDGLAEPSRDQLLTREEADRAHRAAQVVATAAAKERKRWARVLWEMVGKHGRANDPGLYRAAVTLDPSLEDAGTRAVATVAPAFAVQIVPELLRGTSVGQSLEQIADLVLRQDMALVDADSRALTDSISGDRTILAWALSTAGHRFNHHDLWDYDLVSDAEHVHRCTEHRHQGPNTRLGEVRG